MLQLLPFQEGKKIFHLSTINFKSAIKLYQKCYYPFVISVLLLFTYMAEINILGGRSLMLGDHLDEVAIKHLQAIRRES